MKRFSAQYIITNAGPPLKRAVLSTEDDGTIVNIEETSGLLSEKHSVEYNNGIIIPGFVNCHCHLELSHMKGLIEQGTGLGRFIEQVRNSRQEVPGKISESAFTADSEMYKAGISLCADICNTTDTFNLKRDSRISYLNLLEVFGLNPDRAPARMEELLTVSARAEELNLPYSLVPHSVYSMSLTLLRLLKEKSMNNKVTSLHFLETFAEKELLADFSGSLMETYKNSGLIPPRMETAKDHVSAVINEITPSGNLMLVHNTFADKGLIKAVKSRKDLYWCLCPGSNLYIEKALPPVGLLLEEDCDIVIGTDSLASNTKLNILDELITLQVNFPSLSVEDLVTWATINGARALGKDDQFGKIEPGKKPGLLLLQNVDLVNMKLLPQSFVTRLV